jgi:hypothetical protein
MRNSGILSAERGILRCKRLFLRGSKRGGRKSAILARWRKGQKRGVHALFAPLIGVPGRSNCGVLPLEGKSPESE